MKIGIITLWQSNDNYGQQLQVWALQQYLRKEGHKPFLIRYDFEGNRSKSSWKKKLAKVLLIYPIINRLLSFSCRRRERQLIERLAAKNQTRQFSAFRENRLQMSSVLYHTLAELQANPPEADCYITGSDQVWAQLLNRTDNRAFFLDFGDKSIRRISYAPSFFMQSYPESLLPQLQKQLMHFDYVSVREDAGIAICKAVGRDAVKVVDPTLLLDKETYAVLMESPKQIPPYIYIYSINISSAEDLYWEDLKQYAKENHRKVVVTPASGYIAGRELFEEVTYDYATIAQWLTDIDNADLVVTTSFHGIVFSIIMETPFVYVPLAGKNAQGNNRISGLLQDLNLGRRILRKGISYKEIASRPIDWLEAKKRLETIRMKSKEYLNQALS